MAAKLMYFSKFSRVSKRFSILYEQFCIKGRFRFKSLYSAENFKLGETFYSCNFHQKRASLESGRRLYLELENVNLVKNYAPKIPKRFYSKGRKTNKDIKGTKRLEEASDDDITVDEFDGIEVLQELRDKTGLEQGHNVLVIQPDFKWGRNRFHLETVDHMLGEALSLVESINGWSVVAGRTEPIRRPDARYFFGKGKLEDLTKLVRKLKAVESLSAVFLDVSRLTRRQHMELEELWEVKVFDRFSLVLQIFKERAVSSEAKVQVELAELGYIRWVDC